MKLGVFDSGIGGLVIAKSIRDAIPDIDMIYFGDTLHVPYGARSRDAIYQHTLNAVKFLFEQDCQLIIVACNTASANALRRIQQEFLPAHYPGRRVLGVVVPTLEAAIDGAYKRLGLLATNYIVHSNIYEEELKKLNPDIAIFQQASPLLVPLIENEGEPWMCSVLERYLQPLLEQGIDSLLLGCTHYPTLKDIVREIIGTDIAILSQDNIIPHKLIEYLLRNKKVNDAIGREGSEVFYLSDITQSYMNAAARVYGHDLEFKKTG